MSIEFFVAVMTMTLLSLWAHRLGLCFGCKRGWLDSSIFLMTVGVTFLFAWGVFGQLAWAKRMPLSSVIYWSNVTPLLLGFSAGLASHCSGLRLQSRPWVSGSLLLLAVGYLSTPIARPLLLPVQLATKTVWSEGVCLQTHKSTCAPAAAVTLFAQHGILESEQDLAEVCLTSAVGTEALGLYRGVSNFANVHGLQAKVAQRDPESWLSEGQVPNISLVYFKRIADDRRMVDYFGSAGEGHAVTVLGRTDGGRWLLGDPAVGRITWSDAEFRERFSGEAIYLCKK